MAVEEVRLHEPTPVDECIARDPMLRAICERAEARARESAGGDSIPSSATPEHVLKQRYRMVLLGFDFLATREHIMAHLVDFEEALRDLEVCTKCKTAKAALLPEKERTPWRQYAIEGCPFGEEKTKDKLEPDEVVHGHAGFYFALSRDSYRAGRPVFRYHECPGGPVGRMLELKARARWKGGDER